MLTNNFRKIWQLLRFNACRQKSITALGNFVKSVVPLRFVIKVLQILLLKIATQVNDTIIAGITYHLTKSAF